MKFIDNDKGELVMTLNWNDDADDRLNPPDYPQVIEKITHSEICEILNEEDRIWDGMSAGSVVLPYPGARGFYEVRQNAIQYKRVEDAILIAFASKDYQTLGEIIFDQLEAYGLSAIDDRS